MDSPAKFHQEIAGNFGFKVCVGEWDDFPINLAESDGLIIDKQIHISYYIDVIDTVIDNIKFDAVLANI